MPDYDFLENVYFYDRNMVKNNIASIAGNCFEQLAAIICLNKMKNETKIPFMFFNDLSYYIRTDNNHNLSRSSIKLNNSNVKEKYWDAREKTFINDHKSAMEHISKCLEEEGYAIIRTIDDYLKFFIIRILNFAILKLMHMYL